MIEKQMKLLNYQPHTLWQVCYRDQFPKLEEVAVRLCNMSTQSANVERCCKVHKITKSKARNRLGNNNVFMLCYCYVNLRLLNKLEKKSGLDTSTLDFEDFLASAINEELDESTPLCSPIV